MHGEAAGRLREVLAAGHGQEAEVEGHQADVLLRGRRCVLGVVEGQADQAAGVDEVDGHVGAPRGVQGLLVAAHLRQLDEALRELDDRLAAVTVHQGLREAIDQAHERPSPPDRPILDLVGVPLDEHRAHRRRHAVARRPGSVPAVDDTAQHAAQLAPSRLRGARRGLSRRIIHAATRGGRACEAGDASQAAARYDLGGLPVADVLANFVWALLAARLREDRQQVGLAPADDVGPPHVSARRRDRHVVARVGLLVQPAGHGLLDVGPAADWIESQVVDHEGDHPPRAARRVFVGRDARDERRGGRRPGRKIAPFEGDDLLGLTVLRHAEVRLREAAHRTPVLAEDDDVDRDRGGRRREGDGLRGVLGRDAADEREHRQRHMNDRSRLEPGLGHPGPHSAKVTIVDRLLRRHAEAHLVRLTRGRCTVSWVSTVIRR